MANIEAGNDKQLIIKSLVESYGLILSSNKCIGAICAISTIENIYDKYGFQVLDRTLSLCIGTWEGDADSLSGNMLSAAARLIHMATGSKMIISKTALGNILCVKSAALLKSGVAGP